VLDDVRATSSTLAKTERVSRYLGTLAADDLRRACAFLGGAPFPVGDPRRLGVDVSRNLVHAGRELVARVI
jgi:hypothetical protein